MLPKLSICVPTLNRARNLDQLLKCIRGCCVDFVNDEIEICISNNHSRDNSEAVILHHQNKFKSLKYVNQTRILTFPENLLAAINLARGEYIWLMGDDDLLMPNAIEIILDIIHADKNLRLIVVNEAEFDRTSGHFIAQYNKSKTKYYDSQKVMLADYSIECVGHMSRLILHKECICITTYEQRKNWDLMPFLRWVVLAMKNGRHALISDVLVIAKYIDDNPHWRGKWMYCNACELPELVEFIKTHIALDATSTRRIFRSNLHTKGRFQLSILRDEHKEAWIYSKKYKIMNPVLNVFIVMLDMIFDFSIIRRCALNLVRRYKPTFGVSC
ncbi:MAG: glycosyltransferase family 2 protein [Verrucomicrobia bacterium]|nr:glycosyltransferase family 2 protein [Verrucomicrobiota bacterium]